MGKPTRTLFRPGYEGAVAHSPNSLRARLRPQAAGPIPLASRSCACWRDKPRVNGLTDDQKTATPRRLFPFQSSSHDGKLPQYLLRAADVARLTGMSLRTVRRWIDDEIIPSTKLGGARLVPKAELERLLSPPEVTWGEDAEDDNE